MFLFSWGVAPGWYGSAPLALPSQMALWLFLRSGFVLFVLFVVKVFVMPIGEV
ncbi:MAG: hypothetical protein WC708_17480 [Lentisphaeria bacterium]